MSPGNRGGQGLAAIDDDGLQQVGTLVFASHELGDVERIADDNAIGWVFDPYLKCEEDEGH